MVETIVENVKKRATWSVHIEFLFSCISFAVGLGNIWRFPHQCYENGGGAFLIPYLIMLTFLGLPLFFLEMAFGQYASLGPITIWRVCPLFKGIGYMMVFLSAIVSIYYNVIIGYTLLFFFHSFTNKLPWSYCQRRWINCTDNFKLERCKIITNSNTTNFNNINNTLLLLLNNTLNKNENITNNNNSSIIIINNFNNNFTNTTNQSIITPPCFDPEYDRRPAEIFWYDEVLNLSSGINEMGSVQWKLAAFLLLAWIIVFLCIMKGIKSSGKVAYFTAIFPYTILIILFFRGVSLPGAKLGIEFYLKPDFRKMAHSKVWKSAAVQILYSLGPGFGGLLTMSSYNSFKNNCHKDAILVALINCATSVFAGFVIFSVLGFMAHETHQDVQHVVRQSGPGLAFIAYPEALAQMSGGPFWSICFFFMLFVLGLGSQFAGIEAIVSAFVDEFTVLRKKSVLFTAFVCGTLFMLGLPCVTNGGMYMLELIDTYATSFPLLIVVLLEVLVLMYGYGRKRMVDDMKSMIGFQPNYYWQSCWLIITPALIIFIIISSMVEYNGMKFQGYVYPQWAESLGWLIVSSIILCLPVYMIIKICRTIGSLSNFYWLIRGPYARRTLNFTNLLKPSDKWGPALMENRHDPEERLDLPPDIDYNVNAVIVYRNSNGSNSNNRDNNCNNDNKNVDKSPVQINLHNDIGQSYI